MNDDHSERRMRQAQQEAATELNRIHRMQEILAEQRERCLKSLRREYQLYYGTFNVQYVP